ncbi:MAG: aldehyde dehydrogenase family protein [Aestuariivita sp.]|nr:aldehyde dehydrogenase family protein [Aestuariivita sp.]MCY4348180.1 aldehyde dehydrogenase family protein [Aestuariivita sp.]
MNITNQILIDGKFLDAADGDTAPVINPVDESTITEIAVGGKAEVNAAVAAAKTAFVSEAWGNMSGWDRGKCLNRLADLIEKDAETIARLEALEIGRPYVEPFNVDVPSAIATLRTYAGYADKIEGRQVPGPDHFGRPITAIVERRPIGVAAIILPWNAPTMIACWKLGPALASGCTVVVKPAMEAPLAVLHLGKLILEAGIPAGVVNIVPGRGSVVGDLMATHKDINKVSFTGSPRVGARIATLCAPLFKKLTLELGGKGPQIICADADLDAAIPGVAMNIFANQGEICAAGSRIFVHRSMEEEVVKRMAAEADSRKLGNQFDEATSMGALVSKAQFDSVLRYIKTGVSEGARIATGGERYGDIGYFVKPTVLAGVRNDMTVAKEEIFGPVAALIAYDTLEEAIALANDTDYALSANVWTRDFSTAHRLAKAIDAGTVWVNGGGTPDPRTAWGGDRQSGIGKELGWAGIESYTKERVLNFLY